MPKGLKYSIGGSLWCGEDITINSNQHSHALKIIEACKADLSAPQQL